MATRCPVCGTENIFGALVCSNCYHVLTKLPMNAQESTIPSTSDLLDSQQVSAPRTVDTRAYGANAVVMYIDGIPAPLVVYVVQQAVLGRRTVEKDTQPRIDLTPYGAHDRGISRQHTLLRRNEKGISIEDLDSSNGTWVNHKKLVPFEPLQLKSGDRLRLGQFSLEIFFH